MPKPADGVPISMLPPEGDVSEETARAQMAVLTRFVDRLVRAYSYLWPAGSNARSSSLPWPKCWAEHSGLVALLTLARDWHDALENGDGSPREAADFVRLVEGSIRTAAKAISSPTCCKDGHKDLMVARNWAPVRAQGPPPVGPRPVHHTAPQRPDREL